jgi:hypothetical protein
MGAHAIPFDPPYYYSKRKLQDEKGNYFETVVTVFLFSRRKPALLFPLLQSAAPVKIGLPPDPWLVRATHLRFYIVDTAGISRSSEASQKRTATKIIVVDRVAHLYGDEIPQLFRFQVSTVLPCAIVFACKKILQDLLSALFDPAEQVFSRWYDIVTENLAAEPAMFAQLLFDIFTVHGCI